MSGSPPPSSTEVAPELPGFDVIELLSRGRRLEVYDAWSEERGCRCILKTLRRDRAGEERARSELLQEGQLLERCTHPHLVRAYETLLEPRPTVVLETLSGRTLAHVIEHGPPLSPPEIAHLGLHVGSAVRYLHARGFLHLDLKPANVVAEATRAKVIDLSLAQPPGPTPAGVGTPDYMAPEQARGGELGASADVWGIGLLLHESATGDAAFALEDGDVETGWADRTSGTGAWGEQNPDLGVPHPAAGDEIEYRQLEERAPLLTGDGGPLPVALARLIDGCLDPNPAERPALDELLAGLEGPARLPSAERRWSRAWEAVPTCYDISR